MKKIILFIGLLLPRLAHAQQSTGINFLNFDNFKQVLEYAKKEHKNIFIDAYATWCVPCKKMEAEVYIDPQIKDFVNNKLIAIKIQCDHSKNDGTDKKKWYTDVQIILSKYNVTGYPTYLFISPAGELIDKGQGFQEAYEFLSLLERANNPKMNYLFQIEQFRQGNTELGQLLSLALKAKEMQQDGLATEIATAYKKKVIDKTPAIKMIKPELQQFLFSFPYILSAEDSVIQYLYRNSAEVDSILNQKGFSKGWTDLYVYRAELKPFVNPTDEFVISEPNWTELERNVSLKYDNEKAKKLTLDAKLGWYTAKKVWPKIVKYTIEKTDSQGLDTSQIGQVGINNMVYDVLFMHGSDSVTLYKGIEYMHIILKMRDNPPPEWVDTYANLLYRLGKKDDAISTQKRAIDIVKSKNQDSKEYEETLDKMLHNLPTWPTK